MNEAQSDRYRFQDHIGYEIVHWEPGFCRVRLEVAEVLRNRMGHLHGGIHATLADVAMGHACSYAARQSERPSLVTLSMTLNYLSVGRDNIVFVTATVVGGGKKICYTQADIRDGKDNLVSTASGVFKILSATSNA